MKIIIDGDATPATVLHICKSIAADFGIPFWTVASFNHQISSNHHVVVGNDPQETDLKIINITHKGDIVITQDWGLAACVLAKGAFALSASGYVFHQENIDFLLEEREIKARWRRSGGRTKGPRKRTPEDDKRFERALRKLIEKAINTSSQS